MNHISDKAVTEENPLGTEPVGKLLRGFAIPSIIAMLVSSLYNIVDQLFIGNTVGELGNAATNISFPLSTICTAMALLFGIGGAAAFNIHMGRGKQKEAAWYMGNSIAMLLICGICICFVTELFLRPLMILFGSPDEVLDYAMTYSRIVGFGFPFLVFGIGGGHLIRADGRPRMTMVCNLTGAIINTVLDAIFVPGLGWGMAGAAIATVIGQVCSAAVALYFLSHTMTAGLQRKHLRLHRHYVFFCISLGMSSLINQLAMMIVQVVMNNSLKYYGASSVYGSSIPIACVGIITKVNMIYMSCVIGISQGMQPIASYNYGAQKYDRMKQVVKTALTAAGIISLTAFVLFQSIPDRIISLFGGGSEEYVQFAVNYFRIYLFFTFLNFMQPLCSNFFSSVERPKLGMFLSLTRQILFLLPLILLLPVFMGIDGIMYAGPVADGVAAVLVVLLLIREFRRFSMDMPSENERNRLQE